MKRISVSDVGSRTRRSSACYRHVINAVNEQSVSLFLTAKKKYTLLDIMASLIQSNENNETPMIIAIEKGYESIILEMMNILRDCNRTDEMCQTILLEAIEILCQKVPVLPLIYYLLDDFEYGQISKWLEFLAHAFKKSNSLNRQKKIIALELIGATLFCIPKPRTEKITKTGMDCWRDAMTLRSFPAEDQILKKPSPIVPSSSFSVVLENAVEFMSIEELDALEKDVESNNNLMGYDVMTPCIVKLQRQALLAVNRICTEANHGRLNWLYLNCLSSFAVNLMDPTSPHPKVVTNTCLLIFEQEFDPNLLSTTSFKVFIKTLNLMIESLESLLEHPDNLERELSYEKILAPTRFISKISVCFTNPAMIPCIQDQNSLGAILFRLISVYKSISPKMTDQEKQKIEEMYASYLRSFFPVRTPTVLHVAVEAESVGTNNNRLLEAIKLFLKLGANPNAINDMGQTPLHILAGMKNCLTTDSPDEFLLIFRALVYAGSNLYSANDEGNTVVRILNNQLIELQKENLELNRFFRKQIHHVFSLECYCARIIRRHGIIKDRLPVGLQNFVALWH